MFECFMKDIIHESIFDICNNIYDDICYNNNNCHDNKDILNQDLNNFIENGINKLSGSHFKSRKSKRWVFTTCSLSQ